VPLSVRQRLLHDPVRRQGDGIREARGSLAADLELRLQPRAARALDKLGDVLDAGRGRTWNIGAVGLAKYSQDRSQLPDRLVACVLDPLERRTGITGG
jgi:hypothetical protein